MRVAFDTNILVYVEGVNGRASKDRAREIVVRLAPGSGMVSVQALGELFNVLVRKAKWKPSRARTAVDSWCKTLAPIGTSVEIMESALEIATAHRLQIWDSVMIGAADEAGCRLLLSEDLQHGFAWRGVTVVNPFTEPRHPLLEAVLASGAQ